MDRIETDRLILRPFRVEDAEDLYAYARDPRVGPSAGWPPHTSVEESRSIIENVFSAPGEFAVQLRGSGCVIGSASLKDEHPAGVHPDCPDAEIGYCLSPDCWGRGYVPEAVEALLRYGFERRGLRRIWCCHFDGNWRSDRVIHKCGFHYCFSRTAFVKILGETRKDYVFVQTGEEWRERVSGAV